MNISNKYHKSAFIILIVILMTAATHGCAYRLGAKIFSFKKKIEISDSEQCEEIFPTLKKTEHNITSQESLEAVVLKEPSIDDPVIVLSLFRNIINKKGDVSYRCTRDIEWEVKGEYFYDPIELGFYSTLLNYRNTFAKKDADKSFADWIFLFSGWPFAGVDLLTFGIWGMTGGPIIDALIPAMENEEYERLEFIKDKRNDFCKFGGAFTALTIGGPFYCVFNSDIIKKDSIIGEKSDRFTHFIIDSSKEEFFPSSWNGDDVENKQKLPFSGNLKLRFIDGSFTGQFNVQASGLVAIPLHSPSLSRPHNRIRLSVYNQPGVNSSDISINWSGRWNTTSSLRIRDHTSRICAYLASTDAHNSRNCVQIRRSSWKSHKSSQRIPVLMTENGFYKVILSPHTANIQNYSYAYISHSPDLVEDIQISQNDLNRWIQFLNNLYVPLDVLNNIPTQQLQQIFVKKLKDSMEKEVKGPISYNDILSEVLEQKADFIVRDDSPLLRYSLSELEASEIVPLCVIARLAIWIIDTKETLEIIRNEHRVPKWIKTSDYSDCPLAKHIPYIKKIEDISVRESSCTSDSCWVPKEYLP
jgi:hypothetical protein